MAFRTVFISLAPDGDTSRYRATVKTEKIEVTVVIARDLADAVDFVRRAAGEGLIDAVLLCPGFTHEAVAEVVKAAGSSIGVTVARGDGRSMALAHEAMKKAGWF